MVQAFDEMDRNRDNLVTYAEFRYYVGVIMGDVSQLGVANFSGGSVAGLEIWRDIWN